MEGRQLQLDGVGVGAGLSGGTEGRVWGDLQGHLTVSKANPAMVVRDPNLVTREQLVDVRQSGSPAFGRIHLSESLS